MKPFTVRWIALAIIVMAFLSACDPNQGRSGVKEIVSFAFISPAAVGSVSEEEKIIRVLVPIGTDLRILVPTISHTGASINPPSGFPADFRSEVIYSVNAEDGSATAYSVLVTTAGDDPALIDIRLTYASLIPVFTPDVLDYVAHLDAGIQRVAVSALVRDPDTVVTFEPTQPMDVAVGENRVSVRVRSGTGREKLYKLIIDQAGDLESANIGTLKYIPEGAFTLSSGSSSRVSAFRMSWTEITREQFISITGLSDSIPEFASVTNGPAQYVSWYHAILFCNVLSAREGLESVYRINGSALSSDWGAIPEGVDILWDSVIEDLRANGYRLPGRMEWLWAAMGASDVAYDQSGAPVGLAFEKAFAGSNGSNSLFDFAWLAANSGSSPHPVASLGQNEVGLFDMSGNVWEWCWDWTGPLPADDVVDYRGPVNGTNRLRMGASWATTNPVIVPIPTSNASSAPNVRNTAIGFRVVRR